ncbi:hypothetical protein I9Q28_02215 [Campylobacter lari]|uniref:hypothetical protein n=1 Tax=Campylobacter lari TaxID=201 RepID=UPI001C73312A|nr:hypothetical protein [Campylobacter lari]MBX1934295.1 hypothetical protein [Campylobacter lari]
MKEGIIFTAPSELQKGIEILLQYGIEENKIDYIDKLKSGLLVNDCYFENFPIDLLFTELQYEIKFVNCKFNSLECYCGHKTRQNSFIFEKCEFNGFYLINDQQFCDLFQINNQIYFICCIFNCNLIIGKSCANYEIKFHNCKINGNFNIDFKECLNFFQLVECVFMKKVFIRGCFKDNVYLNNSVFCDYVYFYECEFEKMVCFYGITFKKTPNFSICYFHEQKAVNLINVNIDKLDFKSIEKYIEDNYKYETHKNEIKNDDEIQKDEKKLCKIKNEYKLRCAKNLKDSFRVIKDVLISQNNILEAQEWHKLELYAKEKETMIKAKSINDNIDSKNTTAKFLKEELYNFTEWINFILLFVYRNTSNHHTSFLKILNFTVVMIALYASLLFWLQNDSAVKSVFGFIVALAFVATIIIAFISFVVCENIFKLRTSRFFLFVSMGYGVFLLLCFQTLEALIVCCYILLAFSISLMFFYEKYSRFFIVAFAYIVFSVVLIEKPQFINPFIGVFSSEKLHESKIEKAIQDLNSSSILNLAKISHKDFNLSWYYQDISFVELDAAKKLIMENKENILDLKEQNLTIATEFLGKKYTEISKAIKQDKITSNVIRSTSVLYSIILLLCIFSLQKTARKNSIVPS